MNTPPITTCTDSTSKELPIPSPLEGVKKSLSIQARALEKLSSELGEDINKLVNNILNTQGKIVLCGMGKSGIVGKKVAATMSSTGTPALFVHPTESLHGDLGVITNQDLVIFLSKSGENPELNLMAPSLRRMGVKSTCITCSTDSSLARLCEQSICLGEIEEICPLSLAPTTSTTLFMALLDSVAMELMKLRNFKSENYALFHPGGQLGRRLLYSVCDIMYDLEHCAVVHLDYNFTQTLKAITNGRVGAALIIQDQSLKGLITDYDIRVWFENGKRVEDFSVKEMMNPNPLCCQTSDNAYEVLLRMRTRKKGINLMPVLDPQNRPAGFVTLEAMVQHGLV